MSPSATTCLSLFPRLPVALDCSSHSTQLFSLRVLQYLKVLFELLHLGNGQAAAHHAGFNVLLKFLHGDAPKGAEANETIPMSQAETTRQGLSAFSF